MMENSLSVNSGAGHCTMKETTFKEDLGSFVIGMVALIVVIFISVVLQANNKDLSIKNPITGQTMSPSQT